MKCHESLTEKFQSHLDISKFVRDSFACEHEKKEIFYIYCSDMRKQFAFYCLNCGQKIGGPLAFEYVDTVTSKETVKEYDRQIQEKHRQKIEATTRNLIEQFESEKHEHYQEYLQSENWRKKRQMVLARARGICEGCGLNQPYEAHHLTYARCGDEMLFDLVALCSSCHRKLHQET